MKAFFLHGLTIGASVADSLKHYFTTSGTVQVGANILKGSLLNTRKQVFFKVMTEISRLPCNLKILTWNINGIRTLKNLKGILESLEADILCLQETKITRDTIDEETALIKGFNSYFSFSRARSGYSGVATYCRNNCVPYLAEEGLSGVLASSLDKIGCYGNILTEFSPQELRQLDYEGRAIITQHKVQESNGAEHLVHVINVYCPRADPERAERLTFKLKFYQLLEIRAAALQQIGHVIIVGDVNTSHREIDRCEQLPQEEFLSNPGRQWLNHFILDSNDPLGYSGSGAGKKFQMIDSFRYFHPTETDAYTCWNTQIGARSTNYGSRIDYIFVNRDLINNMIDSVILNDVMGSDHCPVLGHFKLQCISADKTPALCSKNYPEFSGTQSTLSSFLSRGQVSDQATEQPLDKKPKLDQGGTKSKRTNQMNILSFCQRKPVETKALQSGVSIKLNVPEQSVDEINERSTETAAAWKSMLKGPQPPPLCSGHSEPCVERIVKKNGPNRNRRFWVCARGEGRVDDPNARCNFFKWGSAK